RVNKSEVQDTFEVPMEFLKKENRKFDTDEDFIEESYMFRDYKIWGATARVLYRFLNLVLS
ncbi:hypothetical protein AKJ36_00650, partial [candidate division MSBL1 archaeon SCGC-AAA259I07]